MALTIIQNPVTASTVYNDNYVIISSDQVNTTYNFYYLFQFETKKIDDSEYSPINLSLKVLPNPLNMQPDYIAGYGEFNINKVLRDVTVFTPPTFDESSLVYSTIDTNAMQYRITMREVYATQSNKDSIIQSTSSVIENYFIDGVLYNNQYWDREDNNLEFYIKSGFLAGANPYPSFLTNRPMNSESAELNSLHIINSGTNSVENNFTYKKLCREPDDQPIVADANWNLEGNDQDISLEATDTGEFWTSNILAISGGYWKYEYDNGNILNPYNDVTGTPIYSGNYKRFVSGMTLKDIKVVFKLELTTWQNADLIGCVEILGRIGSTWTLLATSNSQVNEGPYDYEILFPDVTLSNDYDEIGFRFSAVPYDAFGVLTFEYSNYISWTTLSNTTSLLIRGYDEMNNIKIVDDLILDNTFKAQGFNFNKNYLSGNDLKYFESFAWVHTDDPFDDEINFRLSEIKTITYKCKNIYGLDTKTIVWQNRLGGFDSYEFQMVQNVETSVNKDRYISPTTRYTDRTSQQRRISSISLNQEFTLITGNINKEEINWLKELLDAEYLFEVMLINNQYKLIPISVNLNTVSEKPLNNFYSQLRFNYNYSQIEYTR